MGGAFNWFSQVASVTRFGLLSIPQRLGSVVSAVIGIAGVVAVLVGVLSIATGFRHAMIASGSPDSSIVLRVGADSEMVSGFSRENTRLIADAPGIARDADGALASAELFVVINLPLRATGTDANVPFRGVERAAPRVRDGFKIVKGRMFEWGKNEAIAGVGAAKQFLGSAKLHGRCRVVTRHRRQGFQQSLSQAPKNGAWSLNRIFVSTRRPERSIFSSKVMRPKRSLTRCSIGSLASR